MTIFVCVTFAFLVAGVSCVYRDGVSQTVEEGESVTLHTGVETNQQRKIRWYFNEILIAEINGDLCCSCTDVRCKDADGKFRNRLKLDPQTGSLTIKDTRTTDSGVYKLKTIRNSGDSVKIFIVTVHGFFGNNRDGESAFVMEGDSVTLHTDVKTNQQEKIRWYFNDARIVQITGDLRDICTDVQCNEATERFRDRLNLENQTGSLTIMNTTTTDSGLYRLRIISRNNISDKIFIVAVYDVSSAEQDKMKRKSVMEGKSVTLDPGESIKQNYLITWYFKDVLVAEITGDPNKTCTRGQCEDPDGRFRDRLKLDHQTGSLTIMNITTTDSGDYKLEISSDRSRISVMKIFSVTVTDSEVPSSNKGSTYFVVALFTAVAAAAVAVIYCRRRKSTQARI